MVNAYRETIGANDTIAFDFAASLVQELRATPEATGIRAHLCLNQTGKMGLLRTSIKSVSYETIGALTLGVYHKRKGNNPKLLFEWNGTGRHRT